MPQYVKGKTSGTFVFVVLTLLSGELRGHHLHLGIISLPLNVIFYFSTSNLVNLQFEVGL